MKVAITGAKGQLGFELAGLLSAKGEELTLWNHQQVAIDNPAQVKLAMETAQPELLVNCASYNQVDKAEEEPEVAYRINALGTRNLAIECERHQIPFVHVSTNYAFGAQKERTTPYVESDIPGPVGAYGISKLAGEYFALNHCSRSFVLRTAALFGKVEGTAKSNFIETMLRLGESRNELSIVNDQICTPTSTTDLAAAISDLARTDAYGLYHATSSGSTSWYEYAKQFFEIAGVNIAIHPVTTQEFGAKADRPLYSVLNCTKLKQVRGTSFPSWQQALEQYLKTREK